MWQVAIGQAGAIHPLIRLLEDHEQRVGNTQRLIQRFVACYGPEKLVFGNFGGLKWRFSFGGVRSYWPILRSLGMICLLFFFSETFNTFSFHTFGCNMFLETQVVDIFCMPHHECDSFGTTSNKHG